MAEEFRITYRSLVPKFIENPTAKDSSEHCTILQSCFSTSTNPPQPLKAIPLCKPQIVHELVRYCDIENHCVIQHIKPAIILNDIKTSNDGYSSDVHGRRDNGPVYSSFWRNTANMYPCVGIGDFFVWSDFMRV